MINGRSIVLSIDLKATYCYKLALDYPIFLLLKYNQHALLGGNATDRMSTIYVVSF